MEYYSLPKRNKSASHGKTWTKLKIYYQLVDINPQILNTILLDKIMNIKIISIYQGKGGKKNKVVEQIFVTQKCML